MSDLKEISRRLNRELDSLGYSGKMRDWRRHVQRQLAEIQVESEGCKIIHSGSQAEGISKYFESDLDMLYHFPDTVCIYDKTQLSVDGIQGTKNIFLASDTSPGYCTLQLLQNDASIDEVVEKCLHTLDDRNFLSSEMFRSLLPQRLEGFGEMTGPAHTETNTMGLMIDTVATLPCNCPHVIQTWVQRSRQHDWPSTSLCAISTQMCGNLVATGKADSPTQHLEWRYCFNEIEYKLIESLNDTQIKLYKMLKIINNDILKPSGSTVSSYMLKNVVFWLAESQPQATFVPETLFQWVLEALKMLKHAVEINELQYYMIPGRNLMPEKVKEIDRKPLHKKLSELLELGPGLLLQCKTFHMTRDLTLNDLSVLQDKMESLDMNAFQCEKRCVELRFKHASDADIEKDPFIKLLNMKMSQILSSGWPSEIQQEINKCVRNEEACEFLLC